MTDVFRRRKGRGDVETITQAGEVRSARLESLRALAALGVMAGHIYGQAHGYAPGATLNTFADRTLFGGGYGVYLFFALTGYLLFWPFVRQWFADGVTVDLRRYALNRALRILPLYWTAVAVLLVVQHSGGTLDQWWRFLTFSESFSVHTVGTVDGPMWSLVVEVEFYVLLPLLAWLVATVSRDSRLRAALLLMALGLVSYFVRRHAFTSTGRRILLEYSLPATFMYFVPGMLLALLRAQWEQRRPAWLRGFLSRGDLWLALAVAVALWQFEDYSNLYAIAIASFLAVGACVLPLSRGRFVRALDWRPLAIIGVASYSLYIWHNPIVVWLSGRSWLPHAYHWQLLIAGVVSVSVALISYQLIERPFLRLRRQWSPASAATPSNGPAVTNDVPPVVSDRVLDPIGTAPDL
jgi:peptidoglycan/LPS O-acetylase OafA/YrhL